MVNSPLTRVLFLGGWHWGGVCLGSHDMRISFQQLSEIGMTCRVRLFGPPGWFFSPSRRWCTKSEDAAYSVSSKTPVCYFFVISSRLTPATFFWVEKKTPSVPKPLFFFCYRFIYMKPAAVFLGGTPDKKSPHQVTKPSRKVSPCQW